MARLISKLRINQSSAMRGVWRRFVRFPAWSCLNLIQQIFFLTLFLLSGSGEEEDGPVVDSGEGEVEPDSYWRKKEAFLRGSTVSLGEKFSSGTFNAAFTIVHCLTCSMSLNSFHISLSKLVIFYMQKHFPCIIFMHTDEAHFPVC